MGRELRCDSLGQAAQLAPALATLGKRIGFTAREITKAGCAPLPGVRFFPEHETRLECPDFNKAAMDAILNHRPGTIILAGWWATGAYSWRRVLRNHQSHDLAKSSSRL